MNVLIVHAHEEPKSFNGAMRDTAVTVLARSTQEQRREYLRDYAERLKNWQTNTTIPFPTLEQYDETLQLKAGLKT